MRCSTYEQYLGEYRKCKEAIGNSEGELKEAEGAYLRAEADPTSSAGLKDTLFEATIQCAAELETAQQNLAALKEDNKDNGFEQDRKTDFALAAGMQLLAPDGIQGVTLASGTEVRHAGEELVRQGEQIVGEVKEELVQTAAELKNAAFELGAEGAEKAGQIWNDVKQEAVQTMAELKAGAAEFGGRMAELGGEAKDALVGAGQRASEAISNAGERVSERISNTVGMGEGLENLAQAYSMDPQSIQIVPPPPPPPPEPEKGNELGHSWSLGR